MRNRGILGVPRLRIYLQWGTVVIAICAAFTMNGCTIGFKSNLAVAQDIGRDEFLPCPPNRLGWLCIVNIPEVGYLGVNAYSYGLDSTYVTIRLAPHDGVTVRWAANEMTMVDRQSQIVLQKVALNTDPLLGGPITPNSTDDLKVGYGHFIETSFRMDRHFVEAECRLPPVIIAGKEVPVSHFRLRDGGRIPVVVPALLH